MQSTATLYDVRILDVAERELDELPVKVIRQIRETITSLKTDPRPQSCKKLKGQNPVLWRVYSGRYRILYTIDDTAKIVRITSVGHRKDVYRGLR